MPHKGKLIIACIAFLLAVVGAFQFFGTAPEQAAQAGQAVIDAILSR